MKKQTWHLSQTVQNLSFVTLTFQQLDFSNGKRPIQIVYISKTANIGMCEWKRKRPTVCCACVHW